MRGAAGIISVPVAVLTRTLCCSAAEIRTANCWRESSPPHEMPRMSTCRYPRLVNAAPSHPATLAKVYGGGRAGSPRLREHRT